MMKNRRKFIGHRKNRKHIREEVTKNTQISNKNTFKDESDYVNFQNFDNRSLTLPLLWPRIF